MLTASYQCDIHEHRCGRNAHVGFVNNTSQLRWRAGVFLINSNLRFPAIFQQGANEDQASVGKRYFFILCVWTLICLGNTSHPSSKKSWSRGDGALSESQNNIRLGVAGWLRSVLAVTTL